MRRNILTDAGWLCPDDADTEKAPKTNVMTFMPFGRVKSYTPGSDFTVDMTIELECDFNAIQLRIPNISAAEVPGVRVSVAVTDSVHSADYIQNVNPSTGVWYDLTFGGASSVTLPARNDTERYALSPPSDLLYLT